jgi:hypothetical protein
MALIWPWHGMYGSYQPGFGRGAGMAMAYGLLRKPPGRKAWAWKRRRGVMCTSAMCSMVWRERPGNGLAYGWYGLAMAVWPDYVA